MKLEQIAATQLELALVKIRGKLVAQYPNKRIYIKLVGMEAVSYSLSNVYIFEYKLEEMGY